MEKVFNYVSQKHDGKKALGTRQVFAEEDEIQPNGAVFKKVLPEIIIIFEIDWILL